MGCSASRYRRILSKETSSNKRVNPRQTLLPINENITIRLVPKFFISEPINAKEVTYSMIVHLQRNVESLFMEELTGSVEFLTRTVLSKKRSRLSSTFSYGRNRDTITRSVKASDIKVIVAKGKSICISGAFDKTLHCLGRHGSCHFTLIFKRQGEDEGFKKTWLEGTLTTTNSHSRYSCYWKAVTGDANYRNLTDDVESVPTIVVTAPA